MADLIAQGLDNQSRWRRTLVADRPIVVGRDSPGWATPWDARVSRLHVELLWAGDRLRVRQLPETRNPVFFKGRPASDFEMRAGDHFVIGETTFTLTDERVEVSVDLPQPVQQQTYSAQYLQRIQFRRADAQIEVLSRLPEVILGSTSDAELYVRVVNLMMAGVPRAGGAALVAVRGKGRDRKIEVLHWDRRLVTGSDFKPSERLILEAVDKHESLLHVWNAAENHIPAFTVRQGVDWAFCTPVGGASCQGWGIYVAGRFTSDGSVTDLSDPTDLRDDLKFAELVASTLTALRYTRQLERERAGLSQFFSPVVLEALAGEDPDVVLAPRETEVAVLFCDLRGFSRHSERSAGDLRGLLNRVSHALGVTTRQIREHGGVLGDFHGDSAMGFWGWPLPQPDAPLRAAQAALAIRGEFDAAARPASDPLADFQVGIGVATGRAVAGKIGTVDQVKVTVFGPVVNLAARLEGMTKTLQAPILLDPVTAHAVRTLLPHNTARLRRVAVVRPYGLDRSLEVTELLPPMDSYPQMTDAHISDYERALDDLLAGKWSEAFDRLHRVPAVDRVKDFLTVFIAQHNRTPPENWNGVIPLSSK